MKIISFTDEEVDELIGYFEHELLKTREKIVSLRSVIAEIEQNPVKPNLVANPTIPEVSFLQNKKQHKPKRSKEELRALAEGRSIELVAESTEDEEDSFEIDISKLNWDLFVSSTVVNQDRLVTAAYLVELAIKGYGLERSQQSAVSRRIAPILSRLVKSSSLIKKRLPQHTGFYYGLPTWFSANGSIKREHLPLDYVMPVVKKVITIKTGQSLRFDGTEVQARLKSELHKQKKVLTIDEMVALLGKQKMFFSGERGAFRQHTSELLVQMVKSKDIRRVRLMPTQDYRYALPEWFKKDGELKKVYTRIS